MGINRWGLSELNPKLITKFIKKMGWKPRARSTALQDSWFVATALELLNSVCSCIALSTGQLPFQIVCPVRIATFFATEVALPRGGSRRRGWGMGDRWNGDMVLGGVPSPSQHNCPDWAGLVSRWLLGLHSSPSPNTQHPSPPQRGLINAQPKSVKSFNANIRNSVNYRKKAEGSR